MTDIAVQPSRAVTGEFGVSRRFLRFAKNILVGALCATNPLTAIFALGWIVRRMRWVMGIEAQSPNWIVGEERGLFVAAFANVKFGISATWTLLILTLPFSLLVAIGWWAGWENSFSKGYEYAEAGPLVSLAAMALGGVLLPYLPMAFAHQAAEGDWRAFMQRREVRARIWSAGWRYQLLLFVTAILALPLMFMNILPVVFESIFPGFADLGQADAQNVARLQVLLHAGYAFVALWFLRSWVARLHHRATSSARRKPGLLFRMISHAFGFAFSVALIAQVYVAQFFDHSWARWISQPFFLLPWVS
jgi:hypothetical protein